MAKSPSLPPLDAAPKTNAPEISVSDLANALKRTIEDRFGLVRVRGEISNYRGPHSSGHAYFSLKDAGARLDAVIWKPTFARMKTRPEEGLEVVATGRITTFPGKSSYQIVIESLEPAGVGALMALLDERRKRLAAEGLFDPARKRPLPFLPRVVGVITSPTGSVIRDILHRLGDRFPRRVLVWPVRVQGETCAAEVAAAINGFNALAANGPIPRPDVLIVARGGGSLEDLWGFNEENVARAAAASAIPLIAAIGHETDTTLIDFAADLRAPTPTGAAEKCVPVRTELLEQTATLARRLHGAKRRAMDQRRMSLSAMARLLASPERLLATPRQRLDRAGERLVAVTLRNADARSVRLTRLAHVLARHSPQAELARVKERLKGLGARLRQALRTETSRARQTQKASRERLENLSRNLDRFRKSMIESRRSRVEQASKLLHSLGYESVLSRGFALVRDETDSVLRSAASVSSGQRLHIQFADGAVAATAEAGAEPARMKEKPLRARAQKKSEPDQGSLF